MTKYMHYKGNVYYFISVATHSETEEKLVVYKNDEGRVFVRPYDMFFEKVMVNGKLVDRFKKID